MSPNLQKPNSSGSPPPKPKQPYPTVNTSNLAILTHFSDFSDQMQRSLATNIARSSGDPLDLVGIHYEFFAKFGGNLSRSNEISTRSGKISQDLRRVLPDLMRSRHSSYFFYDFWLHLKLTTIQGLPNPFDPIPLRINYRSGSSPLDLIGSVLGQAQTQPEPTCGHSYLLQSKLC